MKENGASSSVPEVPVCRSLEMASSCKGSEVEVGKVQCRRSGIDNKAQAETGSATHGGDLGDAQMAEVSQGKGNVQEDLTRHSSDGNGEMGSPARCSACGLEMLNVHRTKKDGALRLYCTSCVLYHYQGMYCCQCFRVYPDPGQLGDPALWLTCSKCQRFCHMKCAQNHGLPTNSFFFACQYCYRDPAAENQPGNSTLKRPRMNDSSQESSSLSDQETLAAAQIVAILASKEAKDAKVRARACAAVAAKAAKLAKSALDVAYRAGLEEIRWRHEASRQNFVAAAPMNQTLRKVQMGPYIGNVRTQQITTGLDDKSRQKTFMAPYQRVAGKGIGIVNCDADGSKAAATNLSHHQRRVLPPVVSPDVTGAHFMPSHYARKLPLQQPFSQKESQPICASSGSGQHRSLSSLPIEQRLANVSENLIVDASPESILEGSTLLGTPTADSTTHSATPGLTGNLLHDTVVVEIISDEEAVDDFVYVGDLLAENFEKEGDVSSSLVDLTQNPSVLVPQQGTLVEKCVEVSPGCNNGTVPVMQNHQLSDAATHTGQPPGTTLAVSSQSGTPLVCTQPKASENAANPVSQ